MFKEIMLAGLVLSALLAAASTTFAEADLRFRVQVFARAAVAEAMRSTKPSVDCSLTQHIQDFDRQLTILESEVKKFSTEARSRKQGLVYEFKKNLVEKCCRRGRGG